MEPNTKPTEADVNSAVDAGAQDVQAIIQSMTPVGTYGANAYLQFAKNVGAAYAILDPKDRGLSALQPPAQSGGKTAMSHLLVERYVVLLTIAKLASIDLPDIKDLTTDSQLTVASVALRRLIGNAAFKAKVDELASQQGVPAPPASQPSTPPAKGKLDEFDMLFGGK